MATNKPKKQHMITKRLAKKILSVHNEKINKNLEKNLPNQNENNKYILTGYRHCTSFSHCLLSLFHCHNETINIWSHLIGFFIFLSLLLYTICRLANELEIVKEIQKFDIESIYNSIMVVERNFINEIKLNNWPILVFLISVMICLLFSTLYHLFSVSRIRKYLQKLDHIGIFFLINGTSASAISYIFKCHSVYISIYLVINIFYLVFGSFFIFFDFKFTKNRVLRTMIYLLNGASCLIPIFHYLIAYGNNEYFKNLILANILYIIAAILYAKKIPEFFFPGKFDYILNSHQIMHFLVIGAALVNYFGLVKLYKESTITIC